MAETRYRISEIGSQHKVEVVTGSDSKEIACFVDLKDAEQFVKLKSGRYTEVSDTWLGSEAFYQRFKRFHSRSPMKAIEVARRLSNLA